MNLLQSLLLKLAIFVITTAVIWWIAWQMPQTMARPVVQAAAPVLDVAKSSVAQVSVSSRPATPEPSASLAGQGLLDLNHANATEFERLPGVGPVLAERLVAYRTAHGPFHGVEDLRGVKGIGQKKLAKLKPLVTVTPGTMMDKKEKAAT